MTYLTIQPIPAFTDNYIWCLHDGNKALVVDPGTAAPVEQYLRANDLQLTGILVTHHHWDHVGGIADLLAQRPGLPVWGPARETIPCITTPLSENDRIQTPPGIEFRVLEVPGHTLGHIAYYCEDALGSGPVLLCGDTLFSSGCGRLFEGTPEQMWASLGLFKRLPAQTRVYCTHEYTQANLGFARTVEPENQAIRQRQLEVDALRERGQPSLPTTLALELQVNPFLRADCDAVIAAVARNCGEDPASEALTFARLRAWKDRF